MTKDTVLLQDLTDKFMEDLRLSAHLGDKVLSRVSPQPTPHGEIAQGSGA